MSDTTLALDLTVTVTADPRTPFLATINAAVGGINRGNARLVFADWLDERGEMYAADEQRTFAASCYRTAGKERKAAREKKYAATRRELALQVAHGYSRRIAALAASQYAGIDFGHGGVEQIDWDNTHRNPHTGNSCPRKFRNAGVRVIGFGRSGRIVMENSRGTETARLPMPPADAKFRGTGGALVDGDLFVIVRTIGTVTFAERHGVRKSRGSKVHDGYHRTGVAVKFPVPSDCRKPGSVFHTAQATYWEHGAGVAECRDEYQRKLSLAEADRNKIALSARLTRATRLIARICHKLPVAIADARAAGYCAAGTAGWVALHPEFAGREAVTAGELRALADPRVERPILMVAERMARERFLRDPSAVGAPVFGPA